MIYLIVAYRIITILFVFLLVGLILNKRHLGRFTIFDFITAVTLGAISGADIIDIDKPHGPRIFALLLIGFLHYLFTKLIQEKRKFGKMFTFDPTIVIQNGKIIVKNLKKIRYTIDDLMCHLRERGIFDFSEVEFAILEQDGKLSVLKKSQHLPVTLKDLNIPSQYKGLCIPVILEGKINIEGLKKANLTEQWLLNQLNQQGIENVESVFLALLNTQGTLYISRYDEPPDLQKLSH